MKTFIAALALCLLFCSSSHADTWNADHQTPTYQSVNPSYEKNRCPDGFTHASFQGMPMCIKCPRGWLYAKFKGDDSCVSCPRGMTYDGTNLCKGKYTPPPVAPPPVAPPPGSSGAIQNVVATQSSTYAGGCPAGANYAIDGVTDAGVAYGCATPIAHTNIENKPWWRADFQTPRVLTKIVIWNRNDVAKERLSNFTVSVRDGQGKVVFSKSFYTSGGYPDPSLTIPLPNVSAKQVQVQLNGTNYLTLAEVQMFGNAENMRGLGGTWIYRGTADGNCDGSAISIRQASHGAIEAIEGQVTCEKGRATGRWVASNIRWVRSDTVAFSYKYVRRSVDRLNDGSAEITFLSGTTARTTGRDSKGNVGTSNLQRK